VNFVIENAQVFTGLTAESGASVVVEDGLVKCVESDAESNYSGKDRIDLQGRRLVPGFVDIQVNGGGGVLFNNAPTVESLRTISDAHVKFGTTSILPTLISDDLSVMRRAIAAVRTAIDEGVPGIRGIHLEGPFLSAARSGAHDVEKFRTIDDEAIEILTSLGSDAITVVTLAPEQTTPDRIAELVASRVTVFAGHTAASYEDCIVAENAGLSGYTHLFNAMTPFSSREPGVVGAAIESEDSVFGIIADGHHVHPASVRLACQAKWNGGAILVTDAMPTVGSDKPWFELNGERITLKDGVLMNAAGSLAGSNLSMIEAVRNAVDFIGVDCLEAIRMASLYPATAVGCQELVGSIAAGTKADLIELTDDLSIARVWRAGELAFSATDY